jgi:hypothetical protein
MTEMKPLRLTFTAKPDFRSESGRVHDMPDVMPRPKTERDAADLTCTARPVARRPQGRSTAAPAAWYRRAV